MIDAIYLKHFKCFSDLELDLGKITLLTGRNATGKSSIIQSMLLAHQNVSMITEKGYLMLNGDSVSLGSFSDVLDSRSGRKEFSIGFSSGETRIDWTFESLDRSALTANVVSFKERSRFSIDENLIIDQLQNILHVSTERIGPRETYPIDPSPGTRLGAKGEYTAWFLHRNADEEVQPILRLGIAPPTLQRQAEAWLNTFFPGAGFQVEPIRETNLVSLRFRTSDKDSFYRPANVGYGLSHLLPVIVGGLGAHADQIFVVENPEAHLHPSAQAEISLFLAKVASAGAQVIIESHSDHVLNGIRLAVKQGLISPEEAKIYYFGPRDKNPQVTGLQMSKDGGVNSWPDGFFDQIEKDLEQLTAW